MFDSEVWLIRSTSARRRRRYAARSTSRSMRSRRGLRCRGQLSTAGWVTSPLVDGAVTTHIRVRAGWWPSIEGKGRRRTSSAVGSFLGWLVCRHSATSSPCTSRGYKRDQNKVTICNSDASVMQVGTLWIRRFSRRKLDFSVQVHADQNLSEVTSYWANALNTSPEEISLQRKTNSGRLRFRTWRSRHGVIAVRTNDTLFRARLQGWMDRLQEEWLFEARLASIGA
jgi:hypothetical protein